MTQELHLAWYLILIYFLLGGLMAWGYFTLLSYTLKIMTKVQRKGLFILCSFILRLGLFILFSLILTKCQAGRFIWYILGFMIVRLFILKSNKRVKKHD